MKKKISCVKKKMIVLRFGLLFSLFFVFTTSITAQVNALDNSYFEKYGGVEVSMSAAEFNSELLNIAGIQIDHGTDQNTIHLFMNEKGYERFIQMQLPHLIHKRKKEDFKMKSFADIVSQKSGGACLPDMDFYPTYEAYESLMYEFEQNYPDICRIINIGTLASGRKILVAHIGDNLAEVEDEPNFLYTSTMHGDETGGYPSMIKLIDLLLCNYGTNDRLTGMVNNINIYINPLANPNGTYRGGNDSVDGAIRYNNTFSDLNRNFPDPEDGEHPDGRDYQEETQIFMDFAENYNIQMSCNIHGGAEVANYPWDTYQRLPADVDWWVEQCRDYADTVHMNSSGNYFRSFDNGITNGYDWYEVQGGRQDHMTYFHRGREFTLEISNRKLVRSEDLPEVWNANRASLINYLESAMYGLRGTITDCVTGEPVEAEIIIPGHDEDNSSVFSEMNLGKYFRYLDNGRYDLMVIAEGYDTINFSAEILDKQVTRYDIQLCPADLTSVSEEDWNDIHVYNDNNIIHVKHLPQGQMFSFTIYNTEGKIIQSKILSSDQMIDFNPQNSGLYLLHLRNENKTRTFQIYID